jgi:hypothetical protein
VKCGVLLEINSGNAASDMQVVNINNIYRGGCQNKLCHQISITACDVEEYGEKRSCFARAMQGTPVDVPFLQTFD